MICASMGPQRSIDYISTTLLQSRQITLGLISNKKKSHIKEVTTRKKSHVISAKSGYNPKETNLQYSNTKGICTNVVIPVNLKACSFSDAYSTDWRCQSAGHTVSKYNQTHVYLSGEASMKLFCSTQHHTDCMNT